MKHVFFESLENLDIKNDDIVLVHSSYKSLGQMPFRANDFLNFFIEYLYRGTLIFPGLSHKHVNALNPCFDNRKTKSCVGFLPELFRQSFRVNRSMHPTHSVCAIGKEAMSITESHGLDNTPCGPNSPFALLPKYNGKILMLGCGLKPNTSMHAIEETIEPPYLFGETVNYTLINKEGNCYNKDYTTHNFDGFVQRYDRIIDSNTDNWIKKGKIFKAECSILTAKKLWNEASKMLKLDSHYFVEKTENLN
ncbi:AAC(3) family N-acetyltransferase [Flavivirga rizhaonensis]|uniref:Aminoglycoside N(3)-acetyltransferase n=1 Tax=Flavivirga rizhaonensis TaxID=2559571 RepID=A0A4S1DZ74_9FLAO|nr:AAC(3) family N-acetyltransferase [Flavivirga rizhaonensis]TGV02872.1 AAC(3) family N-acetyltransferase [Flavivirga rizhaonensis]